MKEIYRRFKVEGTKEEIKKLNQLIERKGINKRRLNFNIKNNEKK